MHPPQIRAFARVQVTLTVECELSWDPNCAVEEFLLKAQQTALEKVHKLVADAPGVDFCFPGEPSLDGVIIEATRPRSDT